ncbi:Fanconi anemia group D2 protein isoform X2 [Paramormyrops kingsleyae]|uniref:Fanconi anemia group D2 protein isoform X2 n=1 Tax=Paramormyrops kingsleyae TaxID=1676925 RepID=UPI000CD5F556|nr:Fanconi anemia group D2 protein isoform X2 [Paramormyrops kingsleyae]
MIVLMKFLGGNPAVWSCASVRICADRITGLQTDQVEMLRKKRAAAEKNEKAAEAPKKKSRSIKSTGQSNVDDVFTRLLLEAGICLKADNSPNEIVVDQAVFQKRLHNLLKKSPQYPNIIKEFISGLESYIEDQEKFKNCLLPCVPQALDESTSSVSSYQESLVRLLLGVEILQSSVLGVLFEKLPEFMFDGVEESGLNICHIVINQLKWLDRIVDCKDLAAKLLELVAVAPLELQRDIITSLPEILEDSQHGDIAQELKSLLQQNTKLTVPILDALSSLSLSPALLTEVRGVIMTTLVAVQLEDLPVIVKFILHTVSALDACEVVSDLRRKLDLELCVAPQHNTKAGTKGLSKFPPDNSKEDCVSLLLDVIKTAVRFQKTISEAWMKAVENVVETDEHKVIDLLVLFILHTTNANHSRRGAEKLLRIKVREGHIREALLQRTFRGHGQVMRSFFPSILSLAQILLRSPETCVVSFGGSLYKLAFTAFDSYCQQEVVGSLVTHVCSGLLGEVDAALELLCELVTQKPEEMARYAVFVKGILDYMDSLTPQQIRRLFYALSSLAFGKDQSSHIQDDMHIVLRKQLSSPVPKYRRIGIIGAVMVIGSMASTRDTDESSTAPQTGSLPKERHRQVTGLLELLRSCTEACPESAALYYDELANLLQTYKLDLQVQEWIGKSVLEDFQEDFVIDLGPDIQGSFPFPASVMYNLDEDESQGGIAINLLPLLAEDVQHKGEQWSPAQDKGKRRVSPLCLAPFFRLLRLCEEKQDHGDLEEIDALLGCPLILTDLDVVEKVDSLSKAEREFLCSLLFYTISWFREVANAFCRQKDPEMKMKVVSRLQNITYLQAVLERLLGATPGFVPPLANFDCDSSELSALLPPAAPPKKGKKEGSSRKRKASSKNSSGEASQLEEGTEVEESQQEPPQDKEPAVGVSLASYRPFFRELDVELLAVIQCGLLSRSLLDTELHSHERVEVQLGPAELVFLLEDMWRKLEVGLTAAPAKRSPFRKSGRSVGFSHLHQRSPREIATFWVQLLPTLCTHLENCHNHFQALLSANQGVLDGPGLNTKEHQLMCSVLQLLLQILRTAFSWNGFTEHEQRPLLKSALEVLAGRLKEHEAALSLEELIRHSFEYLLNFRSSVPTLSSALSLTQLLIVISANQTSCRGQIAPLVRHFLCQEWVAPPGEKERGVRDSTSLQALLSIYLEYTDDVLRAVEDIAGTGVTELMNTTKDGSSKTFPTLNRQTFLVFYRGMMVELEKYVHMIPPARQGDSNEVQSERLLTWNLAVRDFHILVNLVKVFDSRPVINVCLKYGRLFLETFLKLGMPLLDFSFKKHKEDVQSLLKTFQLSTRQLHHMCGHSKIRQDTGLTNHVPALKKSLEQFVYRVKAMLALNHCQEAFWLGNLKNRDLQGEEILSQRSQADDQDEEEDASQLPEEESSDEEQSRGSEKKKKYSEEEEATDDSD